MMKGRFQLMPHLSPILEVIQLKLFLATVSGYLTESIHKTPAALLRVSQQDSIVYSIHTTVLRGGRNLHVTRLFLSGLSLDFCSGRSSNEKYLENNLRIRSIFHGFKSLFNHVYHYAFNLDNNFELLSFKQSFVYIIRTSENKTREYEIR